MKTSRAGFLRGGVQILRPLREFGTHGASTPDFFKFLDALRDERWADFVGSSSSSGSTGPLLRSGLGDVL